MLILCVPFVSIINSKFFLVSLAEELKPAFPSGRTCFNKSDPGVSAHEHPYLGAGAVPPSSHPEVPNFVLHLPYCIHHQGNTCTNSLSSICFILSLPNNWQVKSLSVLSCLQYPGSLFPPFSTEAEPVSKVSVLVLQLDINIKFTEGNRN